MFYELTQPGLDVLRQVKLPITYKGVELYQGYKIDLLVQRSVVVEVKDAIHEAQLLSYLKLSGCKVGLLLNFNVRVLRDGLKRMVNQYQPES